MHVVLGWTVVKDALLRSGGWIAFRIASCVVDSSRSSLQNDTFRLNPRSCSLDRHRARFEHGPSWRTRRSDHLLDTIRDVANLFLTHFRIQRQRYDSWIQFQSAAARMAAQRHPREVRM